MYTEEELRRYDELLAKAKTSDEALAALRILPLPPEASSTVRETTSTDSIRNIPTGKTTAG